MHASVCHSRDVTCLLEMFSFLAVPAKCPHDRRLERDLKVQTGKFMNFDCEQLEFLPVEAVKFTNIFVTGAF